MDHLAYTPEPPLHCLTVHVEKKLIPSFFQLLQAGFFFGALVGCSIRELLCDQLGLDAEYVSTRITTVFIDGKPVDDMDKAFIQDGSTLSLSAAMPGLVGAAMRRGSAYAFLRNAITRKDMAVPDERKPGIVQMKLFNMIMEELGPSFLEKGVILESSRLIQFFRDQPEKFWDKCRQMALDGIPLEPGRLREGSVFSFGERATLSVIAHPDDHCS